MLTDLTAVSTGYEVAGRLNVLRAADEPSRVSGQTGINDATAQTETSQYVESGKMVGAYALLRSRQDELNAVAAVVRDVNAVTNKAEKLLSDMEGKLGTLVKLYPPYPLDNPDRISLLNDFGGLRKQIDALDFPAPEELAAVTRLSGLEDGRFGPQKLNAATGAESKMGYGQIKQPLFEIPELDSTSASDAEVAHTLEKVVVAKAAMQELQSRIWQDVDAFIGQAGTPEVQMATEMARHRLAEMNGPGIGVYSGQLSPAAT